MIGLSSMNSSKKLRTRVKQFLEIDGRGTLIGMRVEG
jgi:hypothetical protein